MNEKRNCKLCGTSLWILKTTEGKTVALDLRAEAYQAQGDLTGHTVAQPVSCWKSVQHIYVDHTTLCPKYEKGKKP